MFEKCRRRCLNDGIPEGENIRRFTSSLLDCEPVASLDCGLIPDERLLASSIVSHSGRRFDVADDRGIAEWGVDEGPAPLTSTGSKRCHK